MKNLIRILLLVSAGMNLGCGNAKAMAKRPPEQPQKENRLPSSDRYLQGLELGTQNANRMVDQIRRSTIGVHGCDAHDSFQKAVLAVIRAVKPPKRNTGEDLDLSRGYFQGYSTVFRGAIHDARETCELPRVITGSVPGTIIGSLLCGAGSIEVKLLDAIVVDPVYSGWSGGNLKSKSECASVAIHLLDGCTIGTEADHDTVERLLNEHIHSGCAD